MRKIGIFFGSTTGYTEEIAGKIATRLGVGKEDIHNVMDTKVEAVAPYGILLLGCSTWGEGELQDDWNDFLFKLKDTKLEGKTVAIFGCGDSATYSTSFCDAIGLIYNELSVCRRNGSGRLQLRTFRSRNKREICRFTDRRNQRAGKNRRTGESLDRKNKETPIIIVAHNVTNKPRTKGKRQ